MPSRERSRGAGPTSCSRHGAPSCSSRWPPRRAVARSRATSPTAPRSSGWSRRPGRSTCSSPTRRCRPAAGSTSFSVEEIDRALDVNLRAPIMLARLMSEGMAERGGGQIVFVSSLNGKAGTRAARRSTRRPSSACAASPRACARTCAPRGVGVSTIFPGFIRDAGMFHDAGAKLPRLRRHQDAGGRGRRGRLARSSATARRSTSRRSPCGSEPRWPGWRRRPWRRCSASSAPTSWRRSSSAASARSASPRSAAGRARRARGRSPGRPRRPRRAA